MGMYDEVQCLMPLPPDGWINIGLFQTKSLDCDLRVYRITAEGAFLERVYKDDDSWFGEHLGWKPSEFFGTVQFYDWDSERKWREYAVHVADGHIVGEIRLIKKEES